MGWRYILCADLGQVNDYSAFTVIEEKLRILERGSVNVWNEKLAQQKKLKTSSVFHCRYLERIPLGTSYPAVVNRIYDVMQNPQLINETALLFDNTGVGRAVMDIARDKGLSPIGVTIHGGYELTLSEDGYRVPKRDIIMGLLGLFQSDRMLIAKNLKYTAAIREELTSYVKITKGTRDKFQAWREEDHDDLTLALAIAAWYARLTGGAEERLLKMGRRKRTDWDPLAWEGEDEEPPFNPVQYGRAAA